jgi:phosphosulfolactate synthase (CoM biosynthesis protein A)
MVGQWVDFVVKFKDGGSATYTNGKTGHEMEQRPNHDKNYYPGAPLEVPYMKLKEEEFDRELDSVPISAEDFTQLFQKAYEDDMTWRREKGGPSEAEIRRVAESSGIEMTDELMEKVKKKYEKDPTGGS